MRRDEHLGMPTSFLDILAKYQGPMVGIRKETLPTGEVEYKWKRGSGIPEERISSADAARQLLERFEKGLALIGRQFDRRMMFPDYSPYAFRPEVK